MQRTITRLQFIYREVEPELILVNWHIDMGNLDRTSALGAFEPVFSTLVLKAAKLILNSTFFTYLGALAVSFCFSALGL